MMAPLPISQFDYELPHHLIAQEPVEPRDHSRLLVVNRELQSTTDQHFYDLPHLLNAGDLLVTNDTKVFQARLFLARKTGGKVEFLFLRQLREAVWLVIARPSRRLDVDEELDILNHERKPSKKTARILEKSSDGLVVEIEDTLKILEQYGSIPLPPYIDSNLVDRNRYQTVYGSEVGSAAAPTAGLHFTRRLIEECRSSGIRFASITLHIGLDTFQPVRVDDALAHPIHSEWYSVPEQTVSALAAAQKRGGRILGVGTTAVRALETVGNRRFESGAIEGWTSLYITPPYQFQLTDGLITNFHLPRTTLLMMVTAFAGQDLVYGAYRHAIKNQYRFYSFGDAMLIV